MSDEMRAEIMAAAETRNREFKQAMGWQRLTDVPSSSGDPCPNISLILGSRWRFKRYGHLRVRSEKSGSRP